MVSLPDLCKTFDIIIHDLKSDESHDLLTGTSKSRGIFSYLSKQDCPCS